MTAGFRLRGIHVAVMIILFFAAIIAMNVYFVTRALDSFPGEDEAKSYAQGLRYNETLRDRAAQSQLGWRAEAEMTAANAGGAQIKVRVFGHSGAALTGLALSGALRRPTDAKMDVPLTFRASGDGYVADAPPIAEGRWTLHARAAEGERHLDLERSLTWRRSPI